MVVLSIFEESLPLTNPVLKFFLILLIILFAPILLNKIKIPHLLGLIIAGTVVGPHGLNLLERDSSIILSGTTGLLYIMFLAGLEIDMNEFKKSRGKSIVFGLYTFIIPMLLGSFAGYYILKLSLPTSILLASMFASHTLIAYPLISKMGLSKIKAVNIAVGGTVITDTLALLVLAIIVGMATGDVTGNFWTKLSISIVAFGSIVIILFPMVARWFFKRFDDNVSQYIFVLAMVYFGALLAEIAGVEAIIGSFLAGLALNRLIPETSPLMNRIQFVGNAIFIPFFLIGVGMLIDYRVFFKGYETLKVAAIMIIVANGSKYIAAWLTQKTFKLSIDERRIIFGLSNAQAAATLAAVLVGYNIIVGTTDTGEPIRLLNDSILNGTILMILFTCTVASLIAQKGATNLAIQESTNTTSELEEIQEKILIPTNNYEITEELINLGVIIKSKNVKSSLYALTIVDYENNDGTAETYAKKILFKATETAAATDNLMKDLLRYDQNVVNGISSVVKEHRITDLIFGIEKNKGFSENFLKNLTDGILTRCNTTTLIYKPVQPLGTIKRHIVVIPSNAEKEIGFLFWLVKIWKIAKSSGAKLIFYTTPAIIKIITEIQKKHPLECECNSFGEWSDFLIISRSIQQDDNLIIIMSRKDKISFHPIMQKIPNYLNKYFKETSCMLIYPMQSRVADNSEIDFKNPTLVNPIEKLDEIGKTIAKIFIQK